jgi:hypothetical protein
LRVKGAGVFLAAFCPLVGGVAFFGVDGACVVPAAGACGELEAGVCWARAETARAVPAAKRLITRRDDFFMLSFLHWFGWLANNP